MPRLENWFTRHDHARMTGTYLAPEQVHGLHLVGNVYGHPRHPEGHKVETTTLASATGRTVTTESGSVYTLGRPDRAWLKWLKSEGLAYDPKRPVKVHQ